MQKAGCKAWSLSVALILAITLAGCGSRPIEKASVQPAASASDWEEQLRAESLSGSTDLEKQLCASVTVKVDQVDTDALQITVSAPNIADGLMQWMKQIPDEAFTEAALNEEMLRLLANTKPTDTSVRLPYTIEEDGTRKITYTEAYIRLISCGIKDFYDAMMTEGTRQIEGGQP